MVYIPLKTVEGVCDCGEAFEYEIPKGVKEPTMCDSCVIGWQDQRAAQRIASALDESATACGIPRKYRVWDTVKAKELDNQALLMWIRGRAGSAWIGGTNGIGKTHAVHYCAFRKLKDRGVSCYAVRSSEWLRTVVTMRASDNGGDGENMYRKAITAPLLILDDLGKENLTLARAELLYDIIDQRDRAELPVWITTNFDADELEERLNNAGRENGGHEFGYAVMERLKRMVSGGDIWNG